MPSTSEAERRVHRLRPGDARPARAGLVEADEQPFSLAWCLYSQRRKSSGWRRRWLSSSTSAPQQPLRHRFAVDLDVRLVDDWKRISSTRIEPTLCLATCACSGRNGSRRGTVPARGWRSLPQILAHPVATWPRRRVEGADPAGHAIAGKHDAVCDLGWRGSSPSARGRTPRREREGGHPRRLGSSCWTKRTGRSFTRTSRSVTASVTPLRLAQHCAYPPPTPARGRSARRSRRTATARGRRRWAAGERLNRAGVEEVGKTRRVRRRAGAPEPLRQRRAAREAGEQLVERCGTSSVTPSAVGVSGSASPRTPPEWESTANRARAAPTCYRMSSVDRMPPSKRGRPASRARLREGKQRASLFGTAEPHAISTKLEIGCSGVKARRGRTGGALPGSAPRCSHQRRLHLRRRANTCKVCSGGRAG